MIERGTIYCDGLKCRVSKRIAGRIFKSAIDEAKKEGWRMTKTTTGNIWRHHCPSCCGHKPTETKEPPPQPRKEQWYDNI